MASSAERTQERLKLFPDRIVANSAYEAAEMLGWLVDNWAIEALIPVFCKSAGYRLHLLKEGLRLWSGCQACQNLSRRAICHERD